MQNKSPLDEFVNKTTLLNKIAKNLFSNDKKDLNSQEAFFFAVEKNQIDSVKELLKKDIDINAKDTFGFTPLFYAENVQMAQLLLDHGANINEKGLSGENVLSLFCKFTDEEMVEFYIRKRIDVNAKDNNNITPLMVAKNLNIISMLLKNKADINAQNYCGETALMMAVHNNNFDIVKLLLQNNADLTIKDDNGDDVFGYITDDEMKNLLLSYK